MEKSLEIKAISARGIKNVNLISKMDVYAVVSITGGDYYHKKNQVARTPVDRDGGTNPTWNYPVNFTIQEPLAQQNRLHLVFKLKCKGALGDKDIGEVNVPVKQLLVDFFSGGGKGGYDNGKEQGRAMRFVSYQVRKPSGKPKGELNFSYGVTDVSSFSGNYREYDQKIDQPITAYPAPVAGPSPSAPPYDPYYQPPPPPPPQYNYGYPPPSPQTYSGYPPPPPPLAYGYPPPSPYGYPPAAGYGYPPPPVQQPPSRKNKFGMGLGAGLLGGMLGGLLLGDLVSDAGAYDAGYDAGFGDAGGF